MAAREGLFLALLLAAAPGSAQAAPGPLAADVAEASGLDFAHAGFHGGDRLQAFHESTAGGACWADYDRDGRMDLYLTDFLDAQLRGRNTLYRNLGADANGTWRFADITESQGAGLRGVGQGCAWGDFDNDGWPDLYATFAVTAYSGQGNALLRNLGEGRGFEDVTARAGVGGDAPGLPCSPVVPLPNGSDANACWSVGAAWLDHELDGDLDLYVANYIQFPFGTCVHEFGASPRYCLGQANRLYRNEGDGTFTDIAGAAGVAVNGQPTLGRSLGVIASDIDGDARPDLYVGNDLDASALYLNQGDGTFRSAATALGVDNAGPSRPAPGGPEGSALPAYRPPGAGPEAWPHRAGMGVDAQDFDNDGLVDLLSTHLVGEYDGIYRRGAQGWRDEGPSVEAGTPGLLDSSRWGGGFADLDLDGWKDLLLVAGGELDGERAGVHLFLQRDGRFAWQGGSAWPLASRSLANHRAAAFADYDNDGDLDVLVSALPSEDGAAPRPKLLRFDAAGQPGAHWLRIHLEGTDSARDAFGARVEVQAGGLAQRLWKASGGSYAGNHDPRLAVGLGDATRGTVEVTWPGGATQRLDFDLAGAEGLELRIKEEDRRAPAPPRWRPEPVRTGPEGLVLAWFPSLATDFAAYRVYEEGPGGAKVHRLEDRSAATLTLPGAPEGTRFRVTVVDAGGHESEPGPEVDRRGRAEQPTPFPAALALAAAALAALRSRPRRP